MLLDETLVFPSRARMRATSVLSAQLERLYEQTRKVEVANFRMPGKTRRPGALVGYLLSHSERARRTTLPVKTTTLECYMPHGGRAIEISFGSN